MGILWGYWEEWCDVEGEIVGFYCIEVDIEFFVYQIVGVWNQGKDVDGVGQGIGFSEN